MNLKGMWVSLKDSPELPKGTILNYCMYCGIALTQEEPDDGC